MTSPALTRITAEHDYKMAQATTRAIARLIADDCVAALDGDWSSLPFPGLVRKYAEAVAAEDVAREAWLATTQGVSA